jgi:integrase/recombinase XerD
MSSDLIRRTNAVTVTPLRLTPDQYVGLAEVPPETEWLNNLENRKTRRAYQIDVADFITFAGLAGSAELRTVARSHVIAWRTELKRRALAPASIRRKLSALSSLFDYLCERNAVSGNLVDGVKCPKANGNEGSTPALGERQARRLLDAPSADTLKGLRDRAILATLLYHGLRREELCSLSVKDLHSRQDVMYFRVKGKGDKIRYVEVHPGALRMIDDYLVMAGHRSDIDGPLFRPVTNNRTGELNKPLYPGSLYHNIVQKYGRATGINAEVNGLCVHSLRATAGTNALENGADIAKVQEWFGHANISTTRLYDRRKRKPEDSPTYRVKY